MRNSSRWLLSVAFMAGIALGCSPESVAGVPMSRRKEVREFQQRVQSGVFYRELLRELGKPKACKIGVDEGITLTYSFRNHASLEAQFNPAVELSQQRMQFPGIGEKRAADLLKAAEKNSFGQNGCGIMWDRPTEEVSRDRPGSRDVVYRGDTCNCQARLTYESASVSALMLKSVC